MDATLSTATFRFLWDLPTDPELLADSLRNIDLIRACMFFKISLGPSESRSAEDMRNVTEKLSTALVAWRSRMMKDVWDQYWEGKIDPEAFREIRMAAPLDNVQEITRREGVASQAFLTCYGIEPSKLPDNSIEDTSTAPIWSSVDRAMLRYSDREVLEKAGVADVDQPELYNLDYNKLEKRLADTVSMSAVSELKQQLHELRDRVARWAGFDPTTVTDVQLNAELEGETTVRLANAHLQSNLIKHLMKTIDHERRVRAEMADRLQLLEDGMGTKLDVDRRIPFSVSDWVRLPNGRNK